MKSSGWRVTISPGTEMIHQTVGVEETFLGVEPLLGLQSDLDNIQGSHEERHHQGASSSAHHLLGWIESIVSTSTSNITLGCHHSEVRGLLLLRLPVELGQLLLLHQLLLVDDLLLGLALQVPHYTVV